jgi:hypothetical protein
MAAIRSSLSLHRYANKKMDSAGSETHGLLERRLKVEK